MVRERGNRPPTIHDVASEAGVSKSLVSLAVRGDPGVRSETRARILDAADRLGYRSNPWARSLVRGRSQMIGVLVDDLRSGYHTDVVHGVEDAADANGLAVVIGDARRERNILRARLESMVSLGIDGAVIVSGRGDTEALSAFAGRLALVVVGRPVGIARAVGQVSNDDRSGARLAVHHLAAFGHRRIAHVRGSTRPASRAREESYQATMRELGLEEHVRIRDPEELLRELVAGAPDAPTAVFCSNDRIAIDLIGRAIDAGLNVPSDLSVAGYDNIEISSWLRPSLTSVDQPRRAMGELALRQLLEIIEGGPSRHDVVAPSLVVRESTMPTAE